MDQYDDDDDELDEADDLSLEDQEIGLDDDEEDPFDVFEEDVEDTVTQSAVEPTAAAKEQTAKIHLAENSSEKITETHEGTGSEIAKIAEELLPAALLHAAMSHNTPAPATTQQPIAAAEQKVERSVHPSQIPLQIAVEVARLSLSIHDLLHLAPGNILDLKTAPESGVALMLNGKQVGIGELIQIGETLGIRILKIANATETV